MENNLKCPICDIDESHLLTDIEIKDDDHYNLISITVAGKYFIEIKNKIKYQYRSQKSVHLLIICEGGHYYHQSFDGHKGKIFKDRNLIMDQLCQYLNAEVYSGGLKFDLDFNQELMAKIGNFFKKIDV